MINGQCSTIVRQKFDHQDSSKCICKGRIVEHYCDSQNSDQRKKLQRIIKMLAVKAKKIRKGQPYQKEASMNFDIDSRASLWQSRPKAKISKNANESNARCPPEFRGILVEERVRLQI